MPHFLSSASISLEDYPIVQNAVKTEITIGDLHANALKLIHLLVREGIFFINPENYERFKSLYLIPAEIIEPEELEELQKIIAGLDVINQDIFVRFIGDERADRGSNDWYIDLIFKKMNISHIHYEIIFSNHGFHSLRKFELFDIEQCFFNPIRQSNLYPLEKEYAQLQVEITEVNQDIESRIQKDANIQSIQEFHQLSRKRLEIFIHHREHQEKLQAFKTHHNTYKSFFENYKNDENFQELHKKYIQEQSLHLKVFENLKKQKIAKAKDTQKKSIANLQTLIHRGLISVDDVLKNFNEYYVPYLHLLSYSVDPKTKTISIFTHAGAGLNTLVELSELFSLTFDIISYEKTIMSLDSLKTYFHKNYISNKSVSCLIGNDTKHPIFRFIWNRDYNNLERTHHMGNFSVEYIHGHDDKETDRPRHVIFLYNKLGFISVEGDNIITKNQGLEFILRSMNQYTLNDMIKELHEQILSKFEESHRILNKRKFSKLINNPQDAFRTLIHLFHQHISEQCSLAQFINHYMDTIKEFKIFSLLQKDDLYEQIETLKNLCLLIKPNYQKSFRSFFSTRTTNASLIEQLDKILEENPNLNMNSYAP